MAWTTPKTWASGYVVLAADLNTHLRDNLNVTAPAVLTTAGDILYASGANTPARLAKSTTSTQYLANTGTSNIPAWNEVALDTGISGTLPVGNGGTGATTFTADNVILVGNTTSAVTATATMATKGHVLIGDGSGVPGMLAVGSNDYVLTADSGEATGVKWAEAAGGAPTLVTKSKWANTCSTSRATLITPTSGQKVRILGVIMGIQGAAMGELYFGTGANIGSDATKAIMSSDRGTDDEGYTISFPANGGPVGDADEVVSVRVTAASGVNQDITVHYTEE